MYTVQDLSLIHIFQVCHLADGVELGGALVRAVGDALQGDHLAGDTLKGGLGGSTADLISLGDVCLLYTSRCV